MSDLKPGDRVRTKGHHRYPDGTEFTVTEFVSAAYGKTRPAATGWVEGDPDERGVWNDLLELIEEPVTVRPRQDGHPGRPH